MVVKLSTIFETNYFYVTYAADLRYFFNCYEKISQDSTYVPNALTPEMKNVFDAVRNHEELVIDIANARFTPDTSDFILVATNLGIRLVDSTDQNRNSLLQENIRRKNINKESYVPLPDFDLNLKLNQYVEQCLHAGEKYTCDKIEHDNRQKMTAVVILLSMCLPEVDILIDSTAVDMLKLVSTFLTPTVLQKYKKFYMVTAEEIRSIDFSGGTAFIQGIGDVDLQTAVETVTLVPAVFGTERLISNPDFSTLKSAMLRVLNSMKSSQPKMLDDFLISEGLCNAT